MKVYIPRLTASRRDVTRSTDEYILKTQLYTHKTQFGNAYAKNWTLW
jgi:hypothetical protein